MPDPYRRSLSGGLLGWSALVVLVLFAREAGAATPVVLQAMEDELTRSLAFLKDQPRPPYFLSYEITESEETNISAAFGSLTFSDQRCDRQLRIDLRVGSYEMDSTREVRGDPFASFPDPRFSRVSVPIEDDPAALRLLLWYYTDQAFQSALERYAKVQGAAQVKVEEEDRSPDFSKETPEVSIEEVPDLEMDRAAWEEKCKRYTAPFADHGEIYEAQARFQATREVRWLASSEGSRLQTPWTGCYLHIEAKTKAEDGMELPLAESFFSFTPDGLPAEAEVLARVERMIADLLALRQAPLVEPYTGPAILSGRASAVFFHEVFGHRVEGHRQRSEREGQTFKKMVGQPVLPESFSVLSDPTTRQAAGVELAGAYAFDSEGVRARPVVVVDKGILKSFLMSRKPIEGFPSSNGHGRCATGGIPVARQSNLIIRAEQPVSRAELRRMLLERLQAEGKPFGLLFDDIQGGFTHTGRTMPNVFNVMPVLVYRVFPDGREELVRGVDLIGTPLTAFSRIVAADDQPAVFNGLCGAESGLLPVSGVSPGILVGQIEVQKKAKSSERPPLLPPPPDRAWNE